MGGKTALCLLLLFALALPFAGAFSDVPDTAWYAQAVQAVQQKGWMNGTGEDIPAPTMSPIYAAADGMVTTAEWVDDWGNYVVLDHGNGLQTAYGHLYEIAVPAGCPVVQGEIIGYVGKTGHADSPICTTRRGWTALRSIRGSSIPASFRPIHKQKELPSGRSFYSSREKMLSTG